MGSFRIDGIDELNQNIEKISNSDGPKAYAKALIELLLKVEAEAIPRTPVDTGALRRSGTGNATVTKVGREGARGIVFYTANYAIYVHERTELRHNVGEAKFLENAIKAVAPVVEHTTGSSLKISIFGGK